MDPDGALSGEVLSSRATPEQVRLVVDVDGRRARPTPSRRSDSHPAVGQRVRLAVDPGRLAVWASCAGTPPRLTAVYRRAYALLVGIAVVMGVLAVVAAISLDK